MEIAIEDKATAVELQTLPQLRWVSDAGGPEIRSEVGQRRGEIEIGSLRFSWWNKQGSGGIEPVDLLCSFDADVRIRLRSLADGKVGWSVKKILTCGGVETENETENSLFVSAIGKSDGINAAIDAAKNWDFETKIIGGAAWYQTADETWKTLDELVVTRMPCSNGGNWHWFRNSEKLKPLTDAIGSAHLSGTSPTRDEAMAQAMSAVEKVLEIARELTKTTNDFAAGKTAGRAELRAEIAKLAE